MSVTAEPPTSRFLSEEECRALAQRVASFAVGGGNTQLMIDSSWTGSVRWARNQVSSSGDVRDNRLFLTRLIRGAFGAVTFNQIDDTGVVAALRRAEREVLLSREHAESSFGDHSVEPYLRPNIWSDATYNLNALGRASIAHTLVKSAAAAGVVSAGYVEVSAHGRSAIDTFGNMFYYPYTQAQCSLTVRDPAHAGSGWAGVDFSDWSRIDGAELAKIALEKCLNSRNPSAVEPGAFTAILEPQAVCDLMAPVIEQVMDRGMAESTPGMGPFTMHDGTSKIGQQVLDPRITISADPMDPDLGFPPFASFIFGEVYHPATWVDQGVLTALSYDREYAIQRLGLNTGLPNSRAFRMTGGDTSLDEMIATTQRGLLVTRFSNVALIDISSVMLTGTTRDGLWLIENGKISRPVKNLRFIESPLFVFNNVDQLGPPKRVFRPQTPAVVPPAKVQDFHFTSITDIV